jgi:hypothetical protein
MDRYKDMVQMDRYGDMNRCLDGWVERYQDGGLVE